jgi:predicted esterase YcpF (UPF0227 family)
MKIAYLHGLESKNSGPKNLWLKSFSIVYDPYIDYAQPKIYETLKNEILKFQPDFIIGSSMGGYFAFEMAQEINCPAILFNPALHSRSMEPDRSGHEIGQYKPHLHFILGTDDNVISSKKTMDFMHRNKYLDFTYNLLNTGHQIPYKIFRNEVEKYLEKHF